MRNILRIKSCLTFFFFVFYSVAIASSPEFAQQSKNNSKAIYHTVKTHETLYSIAKKNNVKTNEIKKWNKLKSDNVKAGQKLIVGYAKKKTPAPTKTVQTKPVAPPPVVKPEEKIPEPAPQVKKKEELPPAEKKTADKEITEQGIATWIDDEMINPGKYYALHHSAPMGTIIKVANGINGKSVYVKVVGKISARDKSQNIIIKISKSAADKLEISDERFQAELSYSVNE